MISQHHTSDIGVNIGCDILYPDITARCIRYPSLRVSRRHHSTSDIIITDIAVTPWPILLRAGGLLAQTLKGGSPSGIRIVSYVRHIPGICLTYSKFLHMSGIYLEYTSMPKLGFHWFQCMYPFHRSCALVY